MKFKIKMYIPSIGKAIDMPSDNGLRLFEATHRADLYKRNNPACTFSVVNEDNGDIEYEI